MELTRPSSETHTPGGWASLFVSHRANPFLFAYPRASSPYDFGVYLPPCVPGFHPDPLWQRNLRDSDTKLVVRGGVAGDPQPSTVCQDEKDEEGYKKMKGLLRDYVLFSFLRLPPTVTTLDFRDVYMRDPSDVQVFADIMAQATPSVRRLVLPSFRWITGTWRQASPGRAIARILGTSRDMEHLDLNGLSFWYQSEGDVSEQEIEDVQQDFLEFLAAIHRAARLRKLNLCWCLIGRHYGKLSTDVLNLPKLFADYVVALLQQQTGSRRERSGWLDLEVLDLRHNYLRGGSDQSHCRIVASLASLRVVMLGEDDEACTRPIFETQILTKTLSNPHCRLQTLDFTFSYVDRMILCPGISQTLPTSVANEIGLLWSLALAQNTSLTQLSLHQIPTMQRELSQPLFAALSNHLNLRDLTLEWQCTGTTDLEPICDYVQSQPRSLQRLILGHRGDWNRSLETRGGSQWPKLAMAIQENVSIWTCDYVGSSWQIQEMFKPVKVAKDRARCLAMTFALMLRGRATFNVGRSKLHGVEPFEEPASF